MNTVELLRRFENFWSSVSRLTLAASVEQETTIAIAAGLRGAEWPRARTKS